MSVASQDSLTLFQYGALADGTADDTLAIQRAFDAAGVAGGGTVHFPDGDYNITAPLRIKSNTRVLMDKYAWVRTSTEDIKVFQNDDQTDGNSNIVIDSANIDCSGVTTSSLTPGTNQFGAIDLREVTSLRVHNCRTVNASLTGIYLRDCKQFDVSHNELDQSGTTVAQTSSTIQYGSSINSAGMQQGVISSNRCLRSWGPQIWLGAGSGGDNTFEVVVDGNYIEGGEDNGIRLQPETGGSYDPTTLKSVVVSNNVIVDVVGSYIRINGSDLVVSGNICALRNTQTLSGNTMIGINTAQGGNDIVISKNLIVDQGPNQMATGMSLRGDATNGSDLSRISVEGNLLRGCALGIEFIGEDGTENITDIDISHNTVDMTAATATGACIKLQNADLDRIKIIGNNCSGGDEGIKVDAADDLQIIGNTCWNNGEDTGLYGIRLTNVAGFLVSNNRCFDDRGGSQLQTHGLRLQSTDSNGIVIGNDFRGNATSGVSQDASGPTSTVYRDNLGVALTEVTIATGVVEVTQPIHRVDTQDNDATDDLDTINGGFLGRTLVLLPANDARTVVVKDAADNIIIAGGDFTLDNTNDSITLVHDGTNWHAQAQVAFT